MSSRVVAWIVLALALALPVAASAAKCRCDDDRGSSRSGASEDSRVGRECCKQPWERLTLEHKREKDRQRRLREAAERDRPERPKRACTCRLCGCNITRATYVMTDGDDGDCRDCGRTREVRDGDVCRECDCHGDDCHRHGSSKVVDCGCRGKGRDCDCWSLKAQRGWDDDDDIDTAQERLGWTRPDWRDRHAGSSFLRD
jgi:hypothetical protein